MPASIPRYLQETVQRLPEKTAIVSAARSITFGELYQESLSTAECLREMGIQAADRMDEVIEDRLLPDTGGVGVEPRFECMRAKSPQHYGTTHQDGAQCRPVHGVRIPLAFPEALFR